MRIKYHFLEPGENIALIRLGRDGSRRGVIHVVVTLRQKDFRDLVHSFDPRAALLDFDGIFTKIGKMFSPSAQKEEFYQTGWQELRKRLGPEGQRALDRHYDLYKRGDITPLEWLYISVACYQQYGLTINDVLKTAGAVPFRDGYENFLSLLSEHFDKRFIVSFGLRDWIECRSELKNFSHQTIASDLILGDKGQIEGVRASVTEDTKGAESKQILDSLGWKTENALAIGNSWHDRTLFSVASIERAHTPAGAARH